jgi:fumarate reductase flavoprotein subunit
MSVDYDVVIVGGGGAGLSAAYHAAKKGASVIVVEAGTSLGGATALAGGVVYAAGTSVQRAAGIVDSAEDMYQYMMTLNQWSIKPALAKRLADGGAYIIDWLIELGNEFPPDLVIESGVGARPRGHQSIEAGLGIAKSLINAIGTLGVEVALGSRVSDLLIENGRVVGIRSFDIELRANAVIITTGGFANNPDMVKRLWPTAAAHGKRLTSFYAEAPYNMGDGILLAERAGANITGIDNGLLVMSPNFMPDMSYALPEWAMVVNRDGQRFIPEDASYAVCGYLVNEQPEMRCFAIFDEPTLMDACADDSVFKKYINDPGSDSWRINVIREQVAKGRVKVADTIAELAKRSDIDPVTLELSVERYNNLVEEGEDLDFFKKTEKFYAIRTGPFYAVEIRATAMVSCHSGVEIDHDGHVLDGHGRVVPGLYAGGEVLGCTLGRRYIGGGIGIANALTFGRVAGETAAEECAMARQS